MPNQPTCESCRFWDKEAHEGDAAGYCRIHAPTIAWGQIERDPEDGHLAVFPMTNDDDWCGDHQPKLPIGVYETKLTAEQMSGKTVQG